MRTTASGKEADPWGVWMAGLTLVALGLLSYLVENSPFAAALGPWWRGFDSAESALSQTAGPYWLVPVVLGAAVIVAAVLWNRPRGDSQPR